MASVRVLSLLNGQRGQSALEYILVLAAVLLALIAAAVKYINPSAAKTIEQSNKIIENSANRFKTGLRGL